MYYPCSRKYSAVKRWRIGTYCYTDKLEKPIKSIKTDISKLADDISILVENENNLTFPFEVMKMP